MDITEFTPKKIKKGLEKAKSRRDKQSENIKILFSPQTINEENFKEVCEAYSNLSANDYDTVVIVESHPGSAEKKLPMPSFKSVKTPLGEVFANDKLRNDFADEDDDFFINDDAFDEDVSLYNQLMMLQSTLEDFDILSIQITDEGSFIVKELAYALEEVLASKNALMVFCCDLDKAHIEEFKRLEAFIDNWNMSTMMNYLNSGESSVKGLGALMTGLIVAEKWGLNIKFKSSMDHSGQNKNLITGFANVERQLTYG